MTPGLGLQPAVFGPQRVLAFNMLGVQGDASHRAYLHALRFFVVAHTFSAFFRVYLVNLHAHVNGIVGAFGLAHIAVDALIRDHQSHGDTLTSRTHVGLHECEDRRRDKLRHITAQRGNLTHQGAGDALVHIQGV